jgi:IS30 family transposase
LEVVVGRWRREFSREELGELWRRFRAGDSIAQIARDLDRNPGTLQHRIRRAGGIAPACRSRSLRVLSFREREEISRGLAGGLSYRVIGRRLGRSAATVCREVARNGGRDRYRASAADERAWERARRPQRCLLAREDRLREVVAEKLSEDWSPEAISGWLKLAYPHDPSMRVSHETIYLTLYVQARGALKAELVRHLHQARRYRRPHTQANTRRPTTAIPNPVSISQRPPDAADRAVPGHWEGDLICGANESHIATLVERRSRFLLLAPLESKNADHVADQLARVILTLPAELRQSLTWDRGAEMARHANFTIQSGVNVYFCDPHSPWQRGTGEHTNGLLRRYLPRTRDLTTVTPDELATITTKLNTRPRKIHTWRTPAELFTLTVAPTA